MIKSIKFFIESFLNQQNEKEVQRLLQSNTQNIYFLQIEPMSFSERNEYGFIERVIVSAITSFCFYGPKNAGTLIIKRHEDDRGRKSHLGIIKNCASGLMLNHVYYIDKVDPQEVLDKVRGVIVMGDHYNQSSNSSDKKICHIQTDADINKMDAFFQKYHTEDKQ